CWFVRPQSRDVPPRLDRLGAASLLLANFGKRLMMLGLVRGGFDDVGGRAFAEFRVVRRPPRELLVQFEIVPLDGEECDQLLLRLGAVADGVAGGDQCAARLGVVW